MRDLTKRGFIGGLLLTSMLIAAPSAVQAQGKILRADTDAQGAPGHTMVIVASKIWKREVGISVQVNDSQTLTRSALKLGSGKLEVMPLPTTVAGFLQKGSRMYAKKFKKEAIEASKNVASILGWLAVTSHPVTFVGSGIEKYADIKGKRVFTGPPSGGASVASEGLIRALTGYEPNKDYKAIRMPWGAGLQAMLDGKLDLFFRPAGLGAASVEQIGLKKKFIILDAATGNPAGLKKYTAPPHRFVVKIPPGTYKSQANNDRTVTTTGGTFNLGIAKSLPEDMVYKMTKAIWENLGEMKKTAVTLQSVDPKRPFLGSNVRLHAGAAKYYREKGINIPAHLAPAGS